jgi:YesN/AraC family two-component response regulator
MEKKSILVIAQKEYFGSYSSIFVKGEHVEKRHLRDAFDLVPDCQADVVILDCGFAIGNGLMILKKLKATHPEIPLIFLTDASSEEIAVEAFRAGAREYFKKPVNIIELQNTVKLLLRIKRLQKEARSPFIATRSADLGDAAKAVTTDKPANLLCAIRYIEENIGNKISLYELADTARLSRYHFCRSFSRHMGMSPMKYIAAMRVDMAKDLLKVNDMTVSMVASEVGYNDLCNFIKQFKRLTGFTPARYKASINNSSIEQH